MRKTELRLTGLVNLLAGIGALIHGIANDSHVTRTSSPWFVCGGVLLVASGVCFLFAFMRANRMSSPPTSGR
jgi:hypothetical protein